MPPKTELHLGVKRVGEALGDNGQCRQMTAAFHCAAPRTNNSSGSVARHCAIDTHAMRASAAGLMNGVI
jgi:hypothetical protein